MDNQNNTTMKSLSITFDLPIFPRQIKNWRGAFIEMAGFQDALFHNHKSASTYHYRYPLIQYRIKDQQASIMALGDGVDALQKVLSENEWNINWKGKRRSLFVHDLKIKEHTFSMTKQMMTYRLFKYIPFNKENYQNWKSCTNYIERIQLMQKILTGHILGFSEAMGYQVPEKINVDIQYIQLMQTVKMHKTEVLAFNVTYTSNIHLPEGIGLGRSSSHGFGWQKTMKVNKSKQKSQVYPMEASIGEVLEM